MQINIHLLKTIASGNEVGQKQIRKKAASEMSLSPTPDFIKECSLAAHCDFQIITLAPSSTSKVQ